MPLIILAGFCDWLFHLDSAIRAALLAALAGAVIYLGYRRVLRPLFVRFADLDIAMRIEERWPGLNDRLASTIQFVRLDAADDRHGSPALREATVRQAIEEASTIDFREVIEPKPVIRAVAAAVGVLAAERSCLVFGPRDIADRHEPAVRALRIDKLAASDASGSRRGPDDAQGGAGRFVHVVGQGSARRQNPEMARATYRFADGEEAGEALRSVEGGEFRGRIEIGQSTVSRSPSRPATIPPRSARSPSRSCLRRHVEVAGDQTGRS